MISNTMATDTEPQISLLISFRGRKIEMPITFETCPFDIKSHLISNVDEDLNIRPQDIKLIHKGKVIKNMDEPGMLFSFLVENLKKKNSSSIREKIVIRLMATGYSPTEAKGVERSKANTPRVRDDLSEAGRKEIEGRQRLGRKMMSNVAKRGHTTQGIQEKYGFGCIETLPMLPEQAKAKEILKSLANDPGILACMAKHKWNVGCLAELYPEGKVGESEVCVMGLNQNKGAKILLRLRTDNLQGFRKILNIRKVLFHELAHNVHSEHNGDFYQLMRQVEKECNAMDWTEGAGLSNIGPEDDAAAYQGGTFRLGGQVENSSRITSVRDLAARAALMRMSEEEQEIQNACGCELMDHSKNSKVTEHSESKTTYSQMKDDDMEE
jgi:hypothetical protein